MMECLHRSYNYPKNAHTSEQVQLKQCYFVMEPVGTGSLQQDYVRGKEGSAIHRIWLVVQLYAQCLQNPGLRRSTDRNVLNDLVVFSPATTSSLTTNHYSHVAMSICSIIHRICW